ncbi:MAG TPA: hypothetical protein VEY06_09650 [Flavisolibacter sp.]|nr:hypothetical protein [Flavisolibacter sp.]
MKTIMLLVSIVVGIAACTSTDKGGEPGANEFIYADYKIWGGEDRETVTIRVQFRQGGRNGAALVLTPPAAVTLDGETLLADSVCKIGAFYEVQKQLNEFTGQHTINFRTKDGKEHKQVFSFEPFAIDALPEVATRKDLVFHLEALKDKSLLHIILTDTSFTSNDINSIDTVKDGRLPVSKERLEALVNGPVSLQLIRNTTQVIREEGRRTGNLSITYSLHREFILND